MGSELGDMARNTRAGKGGGHSYVKLRVHETTLLITLINVVMSE